MCPRPHYNFRILSESDLHYLLATKDLQLQCKNLSNKWHKVVTLGKVCVCVCVGGQLKHYFLSYSQGYNTELQKKQLTET